MNLKRLSYTLAALVLTGCATSGGHTVKPIPPSAVALDDAQIRSTLIGNKLNNIGTSGNPYSLSFNADGTEIFQMSGKSPQTEHWTVKDGVICFIMPKDPTECYRLKKDKDDYWLVKPDTGEVHYSYTLSAQ
jgi:hypothetical protein